MHNLPNSAQAGWRSGGPDERGGGRFDREYTNGVGGPGSGPPANPRWKQEPDFRMSRGGGRGGHHGGFGSRPPHGAGRYRSDIDNLPEWATSDDPGVERGGSFDADGKFKAGAGPSGNGERPRHSSKDPFRNLVGLT